MKNTAKFVGLIGAASLLSLAFARDFNGFGRMHFLGEFFSWLMLLLFLSLLVLAILALFQWFRSRQGKIPQINTSELPSSDSALQILRERLAKGEIEVEDFENRKRVLLLG
jgi:putative membrane protein